MIGHCRERLQPGQGQALVLHCHHLPARQLLPRGHQRQPQFSYVSCVASARRATGPASSVAQHAAPALQTSATGGWRRTCDVFSEAPCGRRRTLSSRGWPWPRTPCSCWTFAPLMSKAENARRRALLSSRYACRPASVHADDAKGTNGGLPPSQFSFTSPVALCRTDFCRGHVSAVSAHPGAPLSGRAQCGGAV